MSLVEPPMTLDRVTRGCAAIVIAAGMCIGACTSLSAQEPQEFPSFDTERFPWVNGVAFSPDGHQMFFALLYHDYLELRGRSSEGMPEVALFSVRRNQEGWMEPEILPISGTYHDYEPTVTADGSLMVFNSRRPYRDGRTPENNDLWMTQLSGDGWDPPTRIEAIDTFENDESYGTLAADRTLIFVGGPRETSGATTYDLYLSRFENGTFGSPERHPASSDGWGEADPWVSPDLSYLIFTRWDESVGWAETVDLYISFHSQGSWSTPAPLDEINTPGADYSPAVSPDGTWLYYRVNGEYRMAPLAPILRRHR